MPSPQAAPVATDDPCSASGTVEDIAQAYLQATKGDPARALRFAISDALADLVEAERRCNERDRLISRGYVRGVLHHATDGE